MTSSLPPIPTVDPGLLRRYEREHASLERTRAGTDPAVDVLFRRFALATTAQGIAGIPPSFYGGALPFLLPVPRAFLSAAELAKIGGVQAGLQYVDSRLAMVDQGHDTLALRPETPFVLHALVEGRMDNPAITNPGMIRATAVWERTQHFAYPPPEQVRPLFEEAIDIALSTSAPACVAAGWLMNTTIYLHPFCDANGRVAWLLYLLLAGPALPGGFDWGAGEHWPIRKHLVAPRGWTDTIDELGKGPVAPHFAGLRVLADVSLLLRISSDGAALMRERLDFFAVAREELARAGGCSEDDTTVALAVAIRRIAPADLLADDLRVPYQQVIERLGEAGGRSLVQRVRLPASRRSPGPASPAFALGPAGIAAIGTALSRVAA